MTPCPKCNSTQITETMRQVRVQQADIADTLRRSTKFIFVVVNIGAAILAIIMTTMAPANSDAIGRFLGMGVGLAVFVVLLAMYFKNSVMRTMHVYTCGACRKSWSRLGQDK